MMEHPLNPLETVVEERYRNERKSITAAIALAGLDPNRTNIKVLGPGLCFELVVFRELFPNAQITGYDNQAFLKGSQNKELALEITASNIARSGATVLKKSLKGTGNRLNRESDGSPFLAISRHPGPLINGGVNSWLNHLDPWFRMTVNTPGSVFLMTNFAFEEEFTDAFELRIQQKYPNANLQRLVSHRGRSPDTRTLPGYLDGPENLRIMASLEERDQHDYHLLVLRG